MQRGSWIGLVNKIILAIAEAVEGQEPIIPFLILGIVLITIGILLICLRNLIWRLLIWGWGYQWGKAADAFIRRQYRSSIVLVGVLTILIGAISCAIGITRLAGN